MRTGSRTVTTKLPTRSESLSAHAYVLRTPLTFKPRLLGLFGPFPNAVIPGLGLLEAGQPSTGSMLRWFQRELAGELRGSCGFGRMSIRDRTRICQ